MPTRNIAKKGFSGMRSSSPASISLYLDSDVLRIPFQAILPTLDIILQRHYANGQFIEKQQLLKTFGYEYEERDNFKIKFQ